MSSSGLALESKLMGKEGDEMTLTVEHQGSDVDLMVLKLLDFGGSLGLSSEGAE
jgi:hypothetical protein